MTIDQSEEAGTVDGGGPCMLARAASILGSYDIHLTQDTHAKNYVIIEWVKRMRLAWVPWVLRVTTIIFPSAVGPCSRSSRRQIDTPGDLGKITADRVGKLTIDRSRKMESMGRLFKIYHSTAFRLRWKCK